MELLAPGRAPLRAPLRRPGFHLEPDDREQLALLRYSPSGGGAPDRTRLPPPSGPWPGARPGSGLRGEVRLGTPQLVRAPRGSRRSRLRAAGLGGGALVAGGRLRTSPDAGGRRFVR